MYNLDVKLAKSNGTFIGLHNRHLLQQMLMHKKAFPFQYAKFEELTSLVLELVLRESIEYHDYDKAARVCQEMLHLSMRDCKAAYAATNTRLSFAAYEGIACSSIHSRYSNYCSDRDMARHECSVAARLWHEAANSGKSDLDLMFALHVVVGILGHHDKISRNYDPKYIDGPDLVNIELNKKEALKDKDFKSVSAQLWIKLKRLTRSFQDMPLEEVAKQRYSFDIVRALLQISDHRASAFESEFPHPDFAPFKYELPADFKRRGLQKEDQLARYQELQFVVLRGPTGIGKTRAYELAAAYKIKRNWADRMVIWMPTQFTSSAMVENSGIDYFGIGLYHGAVKATNLERTGDKHQAHLHTYYSRRIAMPRQVATLDHGLLALTGFYPAHHGIYANIMSAVNIIDEADSYDDFTIAMLAKFITLAKASGTHLILGSATIPDSVVEYLSKQTGVNLQIIEDEDRTEYERLRYRITRAGSVATPDDARDIIMRGLDNGNMIIYANTVERAKSYYNYVKQLKTINPLYADIPVTLHHSQFKKNDKRKNEKKILKHLGEDAWKRHYEAGQPVRGIVVITQIGEMSINISADMILSDLCPIDRLMQRLGRCIRFLPEHLKGKILGDVWVVNATEDKNGEMLAYPVPYSHYTQYKHEPISGYSNTDSLLPTSGEYSHDDLMDLVNAVYPAPYIPTDAANRNARKFDKMYRDNCLISNTNQEDLSQTGIMDFKTRDIDEKCNVLAINKAEVEACRDSGQTIFDIEDEQSVGVYLETYKKAVKDGLIDTMSITDNRGNTGVLTYLIDVSRYTRELGLDLKS